MRRQVLSTLSELLLGLLVGYLAYKAVGEADPIGALLSVVLGLLTTLVALSFVRQFQEDAERREVVSRMDAVLHKLGDRLSSADEINELIHSGSLTYPRDQLTSLSFRLWWGTKVRYWATSYISPDELLGSHVHELGLAIQDAKMRIDQVEIRRLYILDHDSELDTLKPLIQSQLRAGVHVRYITKNSMLHNPILGPRIKRLPTLDFAVVDSRIVFLIHLDAQRRVKSHEISYDSAVCAEYEDLLRMLFSETLLPEPLSGKGHR